MQRTAVVWVIYSMTHSAFMLGLTIFAEQFPSFLLSIIGGLASDRYDRYQIIKITQITSMLQSILLAALVLTGHSAVWSILTLSVLLGVINAFDVPARQSMIHEVLYDEADLPNALSLNSAMASLARLAGPALAGILLQQLGAGICFLINAASFGAVIISFVMMRLPASAHAHQNQTDKPLDGLKEAFVYLKQHKELLLIIVLLALVSLLVLPYDTLLPLYAKKIFAGNATTYGYLTSAVGFGAVVGTVILASLKSSKNLKKILGFSLLALGLGLMAFSHLRTFGLALPFAAIIGFGSVAQATIVNTVIQMDTAPHMRGRVLGLMFMAMFGMLPLGSIVIGALSQLIGAPKTVLILGLLALILAAGFRHSLFGRVLSIEDKKDNPPDGHTIPA